MGKTKRALSFLVVIAMVVGMFSGLGLTAAATPAANVGDYVNVNIDWDNYFDKTLTVNVYVDGSKVATAGYSGKSDLLACIKVDISSLNADYAIDGYRAYGGGACSYDSNTKVLWFGGYSNSYKNANLDVYLLSKHTVTVNYVYADNSASNSAIPKKSTYTATVLYGKDYTTENISQNNYSYAVTAVTPSGTKYKVQSDKITGTMDSSNIVYTVTYTSLNTNSKLWVNYYKNGSLLEFMNLTDVFDGYELSGHNANEITYIVQNGHLVHGSTSARYKGAWYDWTRAGILLNLTSLQNVYYQASNRQWYYQYSGLMPVPITLFEGLVNYVYSPHTQHDYKVTARQDPTCTVDGYVVYTCSVCGDTYTNVIPALGHIWGPWTNNGNGTHSRVCSRCGAVETQACSWGAWTSNDNGTHSRTCSVCGAVQTQSCTYTSVVTKPATCTEDGIRTYTCTVCGDTYTEVIPATGHAWGPWVSGGESTHTRICANDPSHTETENHNFVETSRVNPTLSTDGYILYTCSVCGETKTTVLPHTGYSVTITYLYADGTTASPQTTEWVAAGDPYTKTSPTITGYTPDSASVHFDAVTGNQTATVTYSINSHNLTISYVYEDGTQAAAPYSATLNFNAPYSVTSPSVSGYTPDRATVAGNMGDADVSVTVTYTNASDYNLIINYVYADGTTAAPTHTEKLGFLGIYSVGSPVITGYTPDTAIVQGIMGIRTVTVTVTYAINQYDLTIHYLYTDGTTAAPDYTAKVDYNAGYSVNSPVIAGHTPDTATVSGTMGTEPVETTVTYATDRHTLTIRYEYTDGTTAAPTHTETLDYGTPYSVTSPTVQYYNPSQATVDGNLEDNVDVTVIYTIRTHTIVYVVDNQFYRAFTDVACNTPLTELAEPTKTDAIFSGWTWNTADGEMPGVMPDTDLIVRGIFSYKWTIRFVNNADPTQELKDAAVYYVPYNTTMMASLGSMNITGYTIVPVQPGVDPILGTVHLLTPMTSAGYTTDIRYDINSYDLTINYLNAEDSSEAAPAYTAKVNYNAGYNVASPAVTGFTPDKATVSGTMGDGNVTVNVLYTPNQHNLTIQYIDEDGRQLASPYAGTITYGHDYSVTSPAVEGFTPDRATVAGTAGDNDIQATVTYTRNAYDLTIVYNYADGGTAAPTYLGNYKFEAEYYVASPTIAGYTPNVAVVEGTMGSAPVQVTVTYAINTYTVKFLDWDGTVLKTQTVAYGGTAVAPADPTREGWAFTGWNTKLTNVTANRTITALYTINTYSVTFKDWNGSVLSQQTVKHGDSAAAPADPAREGFDFAGWTNGTTTYTAAQVNTMPITGAMTLTAVYKDSAYGVTHELTNLTGNGGSTATHGQDYTETLTPGTGYKLPETITVLVDGSALTDGVGYTYDKETGAVVIKGDAIVGDIVIRAATEEAIPVEKIDDGTVPLAGGSGWSVVDMALMLFAVASMVILLIGYFRKKKNGKSDPWQLASLLPAAAAIITVILTQNLSSPMQWIDKWTVLMAIIAAVQGGVIALITFRRANEIK